MLRNDRAVTTRSQLITEISRERKRMATWVMNVMQSLGYPGLVFLMFVENIFPPIPSELIMPLAGYLAAQGKMNLAGVVAAGTLGSVLGALPLYWIGRKLGKERLERLAERHGRWLTVSA